MLGARIRLELFAVLPAQFLAAVLHTLDPLVELVAAEHGRCQRNDGGKDQQAGHHRQKHLRVSQEIADFNEADTEHGPPRS